MKRWMIFLYGTVSYSVFLLCFLYTIGFVGNLWVPKSIDSLPTAPLGQALAVNLALLGIFAVQHSLMARPFFKRWLTRYIPASAERSTYVLASSIALVLLMWGWQPMGGFVWDVSSTAAVPVIYAVFAAGWLFVLLSTFLINHFDLFGRRQVWLQLRGRPYTPPRFVMPLIYRYVRHPLYLGFFFAFWATPTMSIAHLVFALMCSGYILVGTRLEERDLRKAHPEYERYAREVPRYLPLPRGRVPAMNAVTVIALAALLVMVSWTAAALSHAAANVQAYV